MKHGAPGPFGVQLKAFREAEGFTQDELATIAGVSAHAVSALERGERRRPHLETVRALSAALDLTGAKRDALLGSARAVDHNAAVDELIDVPLPLALTALLGRDVDVQTLRRWLVDPAARLITLTGPGGAGKTRLGSSADECHVNHSLVQSRRDVVSTRRCGLVYRQSGSRSGNSLNVDFMVKAREYLFTEYGKR